MACPRGKYPTWQKGLDVGRFPQASLAPQKRFLAELCLHVGWSGQIPGWQNSWLPMPHMCWRCRIPYIPQKRVSHILLLETENPAFLSWFGLESVGTCVVKSQKLGPLRQHVILLVSLWLCIAHYLSFSYLLKSEFQNGTAQVCTSW